MAPKVQKEGTLMSCFTNPRGVPISLIAMWVMASFSLICCNSPTTCYISVQYSVLDFVNHKTHHQVII